MRSERSAWRRVGVCVVALAALDQAVLPILRVAEHRRYERPSAGRSDHPARPRFASSDVFALGPLIAYLREHPDRRAPRAVFLGNSIVWGYGVRDEASIPAVFQRLAPELDVFNVAVNGFRNGDAYVITKALAGAAEVFYWFHLDEGPQAQPLLPRVVDVSAEDAARFGLTPSPAPTALDRLTDCWRLHRYAYRLQAAWFGTSLRQCLYRRISAALGRRGVADGAAPVEARPAAPVTAATAQDVQLLWDYAAVVRSRGARAVIVEIDGLGGPMITPSDRDAFNRAFAPEVVALALEAPEAWRMPDGRHLTPEGCRAIAEQLAAEAAGQVAVQVGEHPAVPPDPAASP
jgi:hypothetical protein